MRIGKLKDRVTFQTRQLDHGLDPTGQPVEIWGDTEQIWAQIEDVSGSDLLKNNLEIGATTHKIFIRDQTTTIDRNTNRPKPIDRFFEPLTSRSFEIQHVIHIEDKQLFQCFCVVLE